MSDEQILMLINNDTSREKGFRYLMDQYQEMLYQHIRRIVKSHEDSDDILQNTFIKVFKNIDKFQGRSSLYTWIYRIATNEALTLIRKNKRLGLNQNFAQDQNLLEMQKSSDDSPDPKYIQTLLTRAMETLPEKQKSVFSLRYYEEMSYKNMSAVMGTSEGALKASYHHAVKKIESYFKTVNIY